MFYNEQDYDFQQERPAHSALEVKTKFVQFLRTRVADRFNLGADGRQPLPAAAWCAASSQTVLLLYMMVPAASCNFTHSAGNK